MKPQKREEVIQSDLFRSRLENIINMNHALVKLSQTIDWNFLESKVSPLYALKGRPGLSVRLMSGLHILKQMYNLSDEVFVSAGSMTPIFNTSAVNIIFNIDFR